MRKLINLVIMTVISCVGINTCANDLFLYTTSGTPEISEVVDNNLNILPTEIGKTYSLKNGLSIDTSTNSYLVEYVLPQKIAFAQLGNSQVYFNEYDILYTNNFKLPEELSVKESTFTASLFGELYCTSKSTNQSIISTPMAHVVFNNTSLFIKAEKRITHVYVMSGTAIMIDTSSKKKKEIATGEYYVILPRPSLNSAKGMNQQTGNMFSKRDLDEEDTTTFNTFNTLLNDVIKSTLFINYNTNIFGIKYIK